MRSSSSFLTSSTVTCIGTLPKVSTPIDYQEHRKDNDQDSWASYFEGLATPKDNENFEDAYHKELEITHQLQYLNNNQGKHMSITTPEVGKYIASLKIKKLQIYMGSAQNT